MVESEWKRSPRPPEGGFSCLCTSVVELLPEVGPQVHHLRLLFLFKLRIPIVVKSSLKKVVNLWRKTLNGSSSFRGLCLRVQ